MFRKGIFLLLATAVVGVVGAAETPPPVTEGEIWNQGVDYYRAGDCTNAVRVLRPLMLSKEFGARASEVVAKIAYDAAHAAEAKDPTKDLEEAADAAQLALRANPKDARANRNFTRAVDGLPALRETAHVNAVLKANEGKDPAALLQGATEEVRRLLTASGTFLETNAEAAVAASDALAKRATALADIWIPMREAIVQSVTNQQEAAAILDQTEQAKAKTRQAAKELGDMQAGAYTTLADVENDYTRFLKRVILPPAAIRVDLVAQSNAWQDVATFNNRPWQPDALDYTRAFRQKFPAWAQAYEQRAQSDTNLPPFTAEAQAKVSALSTELEKNQIACVKAPDPALQEKSLDLIREIIGLLPPEQGGGGGGQSPNAQPRQQDKNSKNNDKDKSGDQQDQGQQQDQQQDQDLGNQEQDPQQQPPEDQEGEAQEESASEDDKEVEAVLKKAQERSDEHEADKKARMRKAPLPPNERDW